MAMTYEQINAIINEAGGIGNIHCIINDAGSRIQLENIGEHSFRIDQAKNCLIYPTYDDGDPVLVHISLDSIADVRTKLVVPNGITHQSNVYVPAYKEDISESALTKDNIKKEDGFGNINMNQISYNTFGVILGQVEPKPVEKPEEVAPDVPSEEHHDNITPDTSDKGSTPQPPVEKPKPQEQPTPVVTPVVTKPIETHVDQPISKPEVTVENKNVVSDTPKSEPEKKTEITTSKPDAITEDKKELKEEHQDVKELKTENK